MSSHSSAGWRRGMRIAFWILVSVIGAIALGTVALRRQEPINAMWIIVAAACVYVVG